VEFEKIAHPDESIVWNVLIMNYFQCIASQVQIIVLSHLEFPFGLLGSVNLKNSVRLHENIEKDILGEPLHIICKVGDKYRIVRRGIEFDIITELFNKEDKKIWDCTFTIFSFANVESNNSALKEPEKVEEGSNFFEDKMKVSSSIGRTYGFIARDMNPIHMNDIAAKFFGFRKSLAHGMWTVSTSLLKIIDKAVETNLKDSKKKKTMTLNVTFRKPVFVGTQVRVSATSGSGGRIHFKIADDKKISENANETPQIIGKLEIDFMK